MRAATISIAIPGESFVSQTTNLPQAINDIDRLIRQAVEGNKDVMPQIRQWFDDCPEAWRFAGDLSLRAEEKLFKRVARVETEATNG